MMKVKLFSLIIIIFGLSPLLYQSLTLVFFSRDSSAVTPELTFLKSALADHGQEVTLTLHNSSFGSLTSGGGDQVSVFANYKLNDNSIAGQAINAVMEVYAPNGTLIRTSSYPDGFTPLSSGGVEGLETTIRDPAVQSVTTNVTFRSLDKSAVLSNDLRVSLNLAEEDAAPTTIGEGALEEEASGLEPGSQSELEQEPGLPQQTDPEEGGEEGSEGKELPLPLFGGG
jgi:hypothetical protein